MLTAGAELECVTTTVAALLQGLQLSKMSSSTDVKAAQLCRDETYKQTGTSDKQTYL
jgi:hypothetical protein